MLAKKVCPKFKTSRNSCALFIAKAGEEYRIENISKRHVFLSGVAHYLLYSSVIEYNHFNKKFRW